MKHFTGYTDKTTENLLLDAGAFFKNYDMETDSFDSAVAAGKLIGATKGGGEFSAVPTFRKIEIDGAKTRTKGGEVLDSWETYIKSNVIETTIETIKMALGASKVTQKHEGYDTIEGKTMLELGDYIENITWVGTIAKTDKPVIIQVFNALNTDGLKLAVQDKNEGVISMTFYGHSDNKKEVPFEIHYPKED